MGTESTETKERLAVIAGLLAMVIIGAAAFAIFGFPVPAKQIAPAKMFSTSRPGELRLVLEYNFHDGRWHAGVPYALKSAEFPDKDADIAIDFLMKQVFIPTNSALNHGH